LNIVYIICTYIGVEIVWEDRVYMLNNSILTTIQIYKVIAYIIPLLNQIFDDKNENSSVNGASYKMAMLQPICFNHGTYYIPISYFNIKIL